MMKNLFFIALAFSGLGLASCQKAANIVPVSSNISATVDGVDEDFDVADSVRFIGKSGAYLTGINAKTQDRIQLYVIAHDSLVKGTYYTPQPNVAVASSQIMFLAAGSETNGYYTYYTEPYGTDPGFQYFGTIAVSNYNNNQIQGTFSGSVVSFDSVTPGAHNPLKTKSITNGKFNIYLKSVPN